MKMFCTVIEFPKLNCFEAASLLVNVLIFIATFAMFVVTYWLMRNAKSSMHQQLRAYIGFLPGNYEFSENSLGVLVAAVVVKNYGLSPALRINFCFGHGLVSKDCRFDESLLPEPTEFIADDLSVFPNSDATIFFPVHHALSDSQLIPLGQGEVCYALWGRAYYEDTFGAKRETKFCFFVAGDDFVQHMIAARNKMKRDGNYTFLFGKEHNQCT